MFDLTLPSNGYIAITVRTLKSVPRSSVINAKPNKLGCIAFSDAQLVGDIYRCEHCPGVRAYECARPSGSKAALSALRNLVQNVKAATKVPRDTCDI